MAPKIDTKQIKFKYLQIMTNVLKKLRINPLGQFHLWDEVEEYEGLRSDEELATYFHRMLTKFEGRPLVCRFLFAMVGFSTNKNPDELLNELGL